MALEPLYTIKLSKKQVEYLARLLGHHVTTGIFQDLYEYLHDICDAEGLDDGDILPLAAISRDDRPVFDTPYD